MGNRVIRLSSALGSQGRDLLRQRKVVPANLSLDKFPGDGVTNELRNWVDAWKPTPPAHMGRYALIVFMNDLNWYYEICLLYTSDAADE